MHGGGGCGPGVPLAGQCRAAGQGLSAEPQLAAVVDGRELADLAEDATAEIRDAKAVATGNECRQAVDRRTTPAVPFESSERNPVRVHVRDQDEPAAVAPPE